MCRRYCKSWNYCGGVPPNVQLSSEPWGHLSQADIDCVCLSFDRMGAYVHELSCLKYRRVRPQSIRPRGSGPGGSEYWVGPVYVDQASWLDALCVQSCRCVWPVAVGYVYSPYKRYVSIFGSFVLWCLARADLSSSFWRCMLHGRYSSVRLPGRVGRTSSSCSAYPAMGDSYLDGPVKKYMTDVDKLPTALYVHI